MRRLIRTVCVVAGMALLTACGGGGDGGNGGESKSTAERSSLDVNGYANKSAEISATADVNELVQLYADMNDGFALMAALRTVVDSLESGEAEKVYCPGGGSATVSYNITASSYDAQWRFVGCVANVDGLGKMLVDGDYRYVDNLTGQTATSESYQGYETFEITGDLKDIGDVYVIKGKGSWVQNYRSESGVDYVTSVNRINGLEFRMGTRYLGISDRETRYDGDQYSGLYSMSGKLAGSAIGGYVDVSTPVQLQYTASDNCPTKGIIRIESDGKVEFLYGSSASGTAGAMAIWLNNQLLAGYDACSEIPFSPVF